MALPANVGHGTVRGRFIDSNGTSITGKVTFAPTPKRLLNATAEPTPVTILPKPVTVDLDGGEFVTTLIATDDPDNNPQGWNYRVSFNFQGAQADPFNIEVPEGETVDLTTVAPVSASGGTTIIRGPAGEGVPDYEGVEDGKVLVLVDGEPTWGDAPGGGGGGGGPVTADDITDATPEGKAVLTGDAATARSAIGAAADSDVVKLTGNQSVAGTKTFSASPVVPAPSADTHAATKKYVDDQVAAVPIPTVPAGAAFVVTHDGVSWPARPAAAAGQVAIWVGGTAGDPPPGALPNDIHWPSAS